MSQTNNKKLTPDEQKKQTRKGIFGLIKITIGAAIVIYAISSIMSQQENIKDDKALEAKLKELDKREAQLNKEAAIERQNFINRGCIYQGDHLWSCPVR